MKPFYLFLGGAAVGAAVALLLAPESGEETRARLMALLKRKGLLPAALEGALDAGEQDNELDVLMKQITAEIKED